MTTPKPFGIHGLFFLLFCLAGTFLPAQAETALIELSPADPTDREGIAFRLSGVWPTSCAPQSPKVSSLPGIVRIETSNPGTICLQALTPWALNGTMGNLPAGDYEVVVLFSGPGVPAQLELARKALSVTDSSLLNEVVLPIVVNGTVSEKLHYQTIFTILNTSQQDIRAGLQIYGNSGIPGGIFCSPLAPPPSGATFSLSPGAQYFQFSSADLPFLNGWARLRWQGSASILATEELTLAAAAPAPCHLVCNRPSSEKLSSAQIDAIKPAHEFRLPVTLNRYRQTALALINPSATQEAIVKLSILDSAGKSARLGVPDSFEVKLAPLERASKFLWQMALEHSALTVIVNPPESFQGSLVLASDAAFAAGALQIMFPEGKFVPIAVMTAVP